MMRQRSGWCLVGPGLAWFLGICTECPAQDVSQLRGEVFIAGRTPVDPPPDEPKNSHAYMTVSGPAALRLYRAMRGAEEANLCQAGKRMKRAGALVCTVSRDGRNATCDFSVDLINGVLDSGRPC